MLLEDIKIGEDGRERVVDLLWEIEKMFYFDLFPSKASLHNFVYSIICRIVKTTFSSSIFH